MEFRRLISFGKSSFVISVPKAWTERNKLKKGDVVYLQEVGDDILVSPKEKTDAHEPRTAVIVADGKAVERVQAEIVAAYLSNYDVIEVKGASLRENAPEIKRTLHDLAGLELLEQSANRIVAKDLIDLKEISIESIIRRMDLTLRSMLSDAAGTLHEDYYESVYNRDADVNRLVYLLRRVVRSAFQDAAVARSLKVNNLQLLRAWQMADHLELIGDEVKRISRCFRSVEGKERKELEKIMESLVQGYLDIMKSYYTAQLELAFAAESAAKRRAPQLGSHRKNTPAPVVKLTHYLAAFNGLLKEMAHVVIG